MILGEPYLRCFHPLKHDTVIEMFADLDKKRVLTHCPHRPRHGDVYVFRCVDDKGEKTMNWRADGYRWSYGGLRSFRKGLISKRLYTLKEFDDALEQGFQRTCYTSTVDNEHVIVHYKGNKILYHWHHQANLVSS